MFVKGVYNVMRTLAAEDDVRATKIAFPLRKTGRNLASGRKGQEA